MPPAIGACDNRRVFGPNRKELPVRLLIGAGALAILLLLLACGDSGEGGSLDVTMTEFEITVEPESVPEGPIEFTIQNDGEETHDLLVVQTDIAPDELPTNDDGSFDEDAADVDVKEEVDDIEDGDKTGRTYDLDAGNYVLICNIVDDDEDPPVSHFAEGMVAGFEVTEE
jgi:hypothetical protein